MQKYFSALWKTKTLFRRPRVALTAVMTGGVLFLMALWLPNYQLIKTVLLSKSFAFEEKVEVLWTSLGSFHTNFTLGSQISILLTSMLGGLCIALLVYYLKKSIDRQKASGVSFLGIFLSFIGLGCSACGSVFLTSLFGLSSTYWLISILPFGGLEFSIISIGILLFTLLYLSLKIQSPVVCSLKIQDKK